MAVRGVKEYFSDELRYFNIIEKVAREVLVQLDFEEFRPPILEEEKTFYKSLGEGSDIVVNKEMFYVEGSEGTIVLRPEFTAQVARVYVEQGFAKKSPVWKLFYMGPCFRKERPQKGRFREFYQLGIEILGDKNIAYCFEILLALKLIYSKVGIKDYQLNINSIGCFEKCRKNYLDYLAEELHKRLDKVCPICQKRFAKNPLRILDCKNPSCKELLQNELRNISSFLCSACNEDKQILFNLLSRNNINFKEMPFLVRGFDYYTGIVFEYTSNKLGAQDAFCSGGKYDNLLKDFGEKTAEGGVGCALGMERTALILQQEGIAIPHTRQNLKIYIACTSSELTNRYLYLIEKLVAGGFCVVSYYSKPSIKAHLKRAESINSDYVVIIGEEEDKSNTFSIKNLRTAQQEKINQGEILTYFTENEQKIIQKRSL